jgi:hypothetical protein
MNKQKRIDEIEDKLNHLYNRRSKAVEYKSYDLAEDYDWQIEELEDEVMELAEQLEKEKSN